jgi:hypothetical protein
VSLAPYTEFLFDEGSRRQNLDQYQTISAQQEYASFSLEELRLADYEQGQAASSRHKDPSSAMPPARALQTLPRSNDKTHGTHLALYVYCGPSLLATELMLVALSARQLTYKSAQLPLSVVQPMIPSDGPCLSA